MVDTISFIKQRLEPALAAGDMVFADRSSFISALVYGTAEGLSLTDVDRLLQLIDPPKADRLYVLRCPWVVGKERLAQRSNPDHFERKPDSFFTKIEDVYNNLVTGPAERTLLVTKSVHPANIVYIDSTLPLNRVVDTIVEDLIKEMVRLHSEQ
jgi:thymidylate kinase